MQYSGAFGLSMPHAAMSQAARSRNAESEQAACDAILFLHYQNAQPYSIFPTGFIFCYSYGLSWLVHYAFRKSYSSLWC
eukprot:6979470-Karenia_brevis.AAC.1